MKFEGGCYCGAVRYRVDGEALLQGQCHCRECQYISGGGPNTFIALPAAAFQVTKGTVAEFTRSDIPNPVTRKFCPTCGTALGSLAAGGTMMVVKVGTMDDPSGFRPQAAIYTIDKQPFHQIPEGVAAFERLPR
jgi:hypothetical protein